MTITSRYYCLLQAAIMPQKSCGIKKWICKRFWVKHDFFFCPRVHSTLIVRQDLVGAFSQDRTHILVKHFFDDGHYSTKEALLRAIARKNCQWRIMRCIQVPWPHDTPLLWLSNYSIASWIKIENDLERPPLLE